MPSPRLKITACSDPSLWYANLVGQIVPFVYEDEKEYISREQQPHGYLNVIRKEDAEVVWEEGNGT